jgi:hypothetical protein
VPPRSSRRVAAVTIRASSPPGSGGSTPPWPTWRLFTVGRLGPLVTSCEDPGLIHAVVEYGLPINVARDLVVTVAETRADQSMLIAAAAPSLRTAGRRGRLSSPDTDRLLCVGRLFLVLELVTGDAIRARAKLREQLGALGERSALECSASIAGIAHAQALLAPVIAIMLEGGRPSK